VKYNQTHEIMCPQGPFRPTTFTNELLHITSSPICLGVKTTSYPVLLNGETILLHVASCIR